jgi:hypothetical protein
VGTSLIYLLVGSLGTDFLCACVFLAAQFLVLSQTGVESTRVIGIVLNNLHLFGR